MTLTLQAALASRGLELQLSLKPGETVAVMGPNGAGKSSLLQILAGLVKPDSGHAAVDGKALFQLAANGGESRKLWLPPHRRGVGVLAQEPLLFPHLNVLDNVAFGPRSQGRTRRESRSRARHWLQEVDAAMFSTRRPAELSGGQAQRVALARALATDPALLLLDEPMAALDVANTALMRSLLKRVLTGRRAIIITHDLLDALMLAGRTVIMEGGRIVESGPTATVLTHPRSTFAASLAGLNVLRGTLAGSTLATPDGGHVAGRPAAGTKGTGPGLAAFPPSAVSVFPTAPHGSPRNVWPVTVSEVEPQAGGVRVRAGELSASISTAAMADLGLTPGQRIFFVVKAAEVVLYQE
ncbi:sulfate/molybdate ABC transporter ATP-binding protein [Specibacter sp. NPDC057265]|uniref:sulfate/molybdate ABC transporter ATP-binding protein n=1 Tax=Specibacter sp. NPDC057265 TaxID=3346075 RepID=UPI003645BA47